MVFKGARMQKRARDAARLGGNVSGCAPCRQTLRVGAKKSVRKKRMGVKQRSGTCTAYEDVLKLLYGMDA